MCKVPTIKSGVDAIKRIQVKETYIVSMTGKITFPFLERVILFR